MPRAGLVDLVVADNVTDVSRCRLDGGLPPPMPQPLVLLPAAPLPSPPSLWTCRCPAFSPMATPRRLLLRPPGISTVPNPAACLGAAYLTLCRIRFSGWSLILEPHRHRALGTLCFLSSALTPLAFPCGRRRLTSPRLLLLLLLGAPAPPLGLFCLCTGPWWSRPVSCVVSDNGERLPPAHSPLLRGRTCTAASVPSREAW